MTLVLRPWKTVVSSSFTTLVIMTRFITGKTGRIRISFNRFLSLFRKRFLVLFPVYDEQVSNVSLPHPLSCFLVWEHHFLFFSFCSLLWGFKYKTHLRCTWLFLSHLFHFFKDLTVERANLSILLLTTK